MKNLQQIRTANDLAIEFFLQEFKKESLVVESDVKNAYLNNRIKGFGINFRPFEDDIFEAKLQAYAEWIRIILYKGDFDILAVQIKDIVIFLTKVDFNENPEYDLVEKLPNITMTESGGFPEFRIDVLKQYVFRPSI